MSDEPNVMDESMFCRSGCPSKDHASYGECLKAARFGIAQGETARGQYS